MSGWWLGIPTGIKFAEVDVLCAVLDCQVGGLMIPDSLTVVEPADAEQQAHAVGQVRATTPRPGGRRSLPLR